MKRFLIFPSATTLCFFFWVAASVIELMLMTWPAFLLRNPLNASARIADLSALLFGSIWPVCVIGGTIAGLGWALADWMAHRRDQSVATRLFPNLFWCFCYATLLIASNGAVFYAALLYYLQSNLQSPLIIEEVALYGCLLINGLAVLYAIAQTTMIRSVVTPQFVLGRLKRRSRLG